MAHRCTLVASRTVTVRRRGLGALVARALTGVWPTYDVPICATALIELPYEGAVAPEIDVEVRLGRPGIIFRLNPLQPPTFSIISFSVHTVGNP